MVTSTYGLSDISGRITLNQTTAGNQTSPAVATMGDGSFVVAYNDGAGLIRLRQFSSAGAALGDEVVVSGGVANDIDPKITRLSDGHLVVTWSDDVGLNDNVVQRVYSSTLQPLTSSLRVNPGGTTATNADVAALGDGSYVVAYELNKSTTDHDLYVQRYNTNGVAMGGPLAVDASTTHTTDISVAGLLNGGYAVAYASHANPATSDNTTLMRAVYETDGTVRLAPTVTDAPGTGISTYNDLPDVVGLPDGSFMINYRNSADGNVPAPQITALTVKADGSIDHLSEVGNAGSLGPTQPSAAVSLTGYTLVTSAAYGPHAVSGAYDPLVLLAPGATTPDATGQPSAAGSSTEPAVAWLTEGLAVQVYTNSATYSDSNGGDGNGSSIAATLWQVERRSIGSEASETVWFDGLNDRVTMVGGDDGVFLGEGNNTLDLGNGNDTGFGGSGPDAIYGGAGVDWLYGNGGADYLFGGVDTDALLGGDGNDFLFGEAGDDYVFGEDGNDAISGGAGIDRLYGGYGADTLDGGDDTDALYGDADGSFGVGNDLLYGGAGDDYLYGGGNNDTLFGGTGNDVLSGDTGTDILVGDTGNDWLIGGLAADLFQFQGLDSGIDTIADFTTGTDAIQLIGTARTSAADAMANLVQSGANTVLMTSATSGIIFLNTQASQFIIGEFVVG